MNSPGGRHVVKPSCFFKPRSCSPDVLHVGSGDKLMTAGMSTFPPQTRNKEQGTHRHLHRSPPRGRLLRHRKTRALSKTPSQSTSLLFVGRPQGKVKRRRSQRPQTRVALASPSEIQAHQHISRTISPCLSPPSQRCLPPLSLFLPFLPLPLRLSPSSIRVRRTLSQNTPEP